MTQKGQLWVFHEDAEAQFGGEGVIRRVLAYDEGMMMVENTFETGAKARFTAIPICRRPILRKVSSPLKLTAWGQP